MRCWQRLAVLVAFLEAATGFVAPASGQTESPPPLKLPGPTDVVSAVRDALGSALPPPSTACTLPAGTVVKYWHSTYSATDNRCTPDDPDKGECHLKGWLFKPGGGHDYPALMYVTGSGTSKNQDDTCEFTSYFVNHGYVVFAPTPRGVKDRTPDNDPYHATSTGVYIEDWVDAQLSTSYLRDCEAAGNTYEDCKAYLELSYMFDEVLDLQDAMKWLKEQTAGRSHLLVASDKIAAAGHSFGGAEILLAAARWPEDRIPAVTVDMSGGVLSWHSSDVWSSTLNVNASDHQMPIWMFQNTNESPWFEQGDSKAIQSTVQPFLHADGNGTGEARMTVFSQLHNLDPDCVASKGTAECAHTTFIQDKVQVMRWAPEMRDFMRHHGVK